jgi:uncharacterized protein (TIGR02145 family)
MKKILTIILGITFAYSCSTSNDGNGNSTTTVVPVAPSNLTGTVASTTQINLSWTDNSTNETGFKIERKTGNGTYAVVGTTATDVTTFNDTSLTPSTTYTYRVYSFNSVGNSLASSNELSLTITIPSVTDVDGNTYQLVTISNQIWTKTNLNVSKYRNGDIIPQVTNSLQWANLTTGAWCYYNNDSANGMVYGKLYNWYAVIDPRGLAPVGYHIPSTNEWQNLVGNFGGQALAGSALKESGILHWMSPNTDATNSSGLTGLPGGSCSQYGTFSSLKYNAYFWSSTEEFVSTSRYVDLNFNNVISMSNFDNKLNGFSVRCLKN